MMKLGRSVAAALLALLVCSGAATAQQGYPQTPMQDVATRYYAVMEQIYTNQQWGNYYYEMSRWAASQGDSYSADYYNQLGTQYLEANVPLWQEADQLVAQYYQMYNQPLNGGVNTGGGPTGGAPTGGGTAGGNTGGGATTGGGGQCSGVDLLGNCVP